MAFPDLRSFGRRRTRQLTSRQRQLLDVVLPAVRLDLTRDAPSDIATLFDLQTNEVWLEIGFGGGEHLLWQARQNPAIGIIGCEPFIDGTVKVLDAIEGDPLKNIRLYDEDARDVARWLPGQCLSRVFILFPDPWPKKRHNKRRLVTAALLAELARLMPSGAELRIGTDIGDYARGIMHAVRQVSEFRWTAGAAADWRCRPDDWPQTRYEEKAIAAGRPRYYFCFERH